MPDPHDVRNSTVGIKGVLYPYWKSELLHDQDWNLILSYLERIENACNEPERTSKQVCPDGR
jgi:hypothetical protein